jgi:hypothetical protein
MVEPNAADTPPLVAPGNQRRRHWALALFVGLLCGAATSAGVWLGVPDQFAASAAIRIHPDASGVLRPKEDAHVVDFERFKRTQRQLILNPRLLTSAIQRVSAANLPSLGEPAAALAWLQQQISVTFPDEAEIMYVGVRGCPDRTSAQALTDAIVAVYLEDVTDTDRQDKLTRLTDLEREFAEGQESLRKKRLDAHTTAEVAGVAEVGSLSPTQKLALREYWLIWKQLSQVQLELMVLRHKRDAAEAKLQPAAKSATPKDNTSSSQFDDSIAAQELIQRALTQRIESMKMEIKKISRPSVDLELMQMEVKALNEVQERLIHDLVQARSEVARAKPRVVRLSAATATDDDDRRVRFTTICGLAAFLASGAVVVLWNSRARLKA